MIDKQHGMGLQRLRTPYPLRVACALFPVSDATFRVRRGQASSLEPAVDGNHARAEASVSTIIGSLVNSPTICAPLAAPCVGFSFSTYPESVADGQV